MARLQDSRAALLEQTMEMRRKEKLRVDDAFMDEVFAGCEGIFVAFMDGDFPYCLPFNFARSGKIIYIHSALRGHKLECLRNNPHVAFALACDIEIDRARSSTWFKSACGRGIARVVEDIGEKRQALDLLSLRYDAQCSRPAPEAMAARVAIIRIDIISMTGKNSAPS